MCPFRRPSCRAHLHSVRLQCISPRPWIAKCELKPRPEQPCLPPEGKRPSGMRAAHADRARRQEPCRPDDRNMSENQMTEICSKSGPAPNPARKLGSFPAAYCTASHRVAPSDTRKTMFPGAWGVSPHSRPHVLRDVPFSQLHQHPSSFPPAMKSLLAGGFLPHRSSFLPAECFLPHRSSFLPRRASFQRRSPLSFRRRVPAIPTGPQDLDLRRKWKKIRPPGSAKA